MMSSIPHSNLLRRAEDLADRCDRSGSVTSTGFLTPAEQFELTRWAADRGDAALFLHGGGNECERKAAFFLPFWLPPEDFDPAEYIRALRIDAFYGEPTHRDYLGSVLGLGIQREWLGDIRIFGQQAWLFCLPSVEGLLLEELSRVGRVSVRVSACPLSDVPEQERKVKRLSFTVKSPRLDAVAASMFGVSRTTAAELIRMGAVTLNYEPCEHTDAVIREGDVISIRGRGKGVLTSFGGRSRKDRLFAEAEILL